MKNRKAFEERLTKKFGVEIFRHIHRLTVLPGATPAGLARRLGVSRQAISQIFHKLMGVPYEGFKQKKIRKLRGESDVDCLYRYNPIASIGWIAKDSVFKRRHEISVVVFKKCQELGYKMTMEKARGPFRVNEKKAVLRYAESVFKIGRPAGAYYRIHVKNLKETGCDVVIVCVPPLDLYLIIPVERLKVRHFLHIRADGDITKLQEYKDRWDFLGLVKILEESEKNIEKSKIISKARKVTIHPIHKRN